jgi:hypothetical protein
MATTDTTRLLPKLLFLAENLREKTPAIPRILTPYIPQMDMILIMSGGLSSAAAQMMMPESQLAGVINSGKVANIDPSTFKNIIAQIVFTSESLMALPLGRRLSIIAELDRWINKAKGEMIPYEVANLMNPGVIKDIEKWETGFLPFDTITGGFYQALLCLMAAPGTGKTSVTWSLIECIKRMHPDWRILFFNIEIPKQLMLGRIKPIFERGNPFGADDELYSGSVGLSTIMEIVMANVDRAPEADKNKLVVVVDSPDAMSGEGESRRFDLEEIYRSLIKVKSVSQLVIATSQPRRKDGGTLSQDSVAESWAKAWYSDIIIGMMPYLQGRLSAKVLKNRFGPPAKSVIVDYNYLELTAEMGGDEEDF